MRLQKFLAEAGVASRRESERIIALGRARVNGAVAKVGDSVDPTVDRVTLDGRPIAPSQKLYILLHKPKGVITSASDPHDRKTVLDCLKGIDQRVFPVGRLDLDVSGVLLMTNDGELANSLAHPKFQVDKVYDAWVKGIVRPRTLERMRKGVRLDDGPARADVRVLDTQKTSTLIQLTLHEGRNRIVKRLCDRVGHPVLQLQRVAVGKMGLGNLAPGEWRFLTDKEVGSLRGQAKTKSKQIRRKRRN